MLNFRGEPVPLVPPLDPPLLLFSSLLTTVLVQLLNKMHMKNVFHNEFRMIIFHDQKTLSLDLKSRRLHVFFKIAVLKNFSIFKIIMLVIKYCASADLFLIKNITWNGFY